MLYNTLHIRVDRLLLLLTSIIACNSSCKKLVELEAPQTELIGNTAFLSDPTATSAVLGIYSQMAADNNLTLANFNTSFYGGLSSDELKDYSYASTFGEFYANSLTSANTNIRNYWGNAYQYIYYANAVLENLLNSRNLSEPVKQQLEGEAKFIRAFCYFHLTNLFGSVPLTLSTDYRINSAIERTDSKEVYQQILSDLKDAEASLNTNYVNFENSSTFERVRPNKSAATALLARVYLYLNQWANAEAQATSIINNTAKYKLTSLDSTFLKNSAEAIWQLAPTSKTINTTEGNMFILTSVPAGSPATALTNELVNSFELNDNRKLRWVGTFKSGMQTYYFPYKYKIKTGSVLTEYIMVLRLAEQYLIRAEARLNQDNISDALADLNVVRTRSGLTAITYTDKSSALLALEQERKIELFTEWGHRWFDLKRWKKADMILSKVKGNAWQSTDTLYPIPESERQNNPNLTQNRGY